MRALIICPLRSLGDLDFENEPCTVLYEKVSDDIVLTQVRRNSIGGRDVLPVLDSASKQAIIHQLKES